MSDSVQVLWQEICRAYSGEVIPYEVGKAKRELDGLAEQLEAAQREASDNAKAASSLNADVSSFGRALQRIADAVEAWDNDETPDEDFPFDADMDFVNFCGHVARTALAGDAFPASEPEGQ